MNVGATSRELLALRSLHDVITSVHGRQDLEGVLQSAAQGVVDVLGFEVAVIDCVDDHGYVEALAVAGDPDAVATMKGRRIPLVEILQEFDIAEEWGLLRFVPHDRLDPEAATSWVPDLEPLDVPDAWHPLDALYAPLLGPTGELVGVLSVDVPVDRRRPGPLARQVLEMFAVQAGLAIHHAQERARLSERLRLGSAVRTVVETASRELDLQSIIDATIAPMTGGFRCDRLLVRVLDDPGAAPSRRAGRQMPGDGTTYPPQLADWLHPRLEAIGGEVSAAQLMALGERIARECWDSTSARIVDAELPPHASFIDARDLTLLRTLMAALRATSVMLVPLGSGPHCVGHLTMVRDGGEPWSVAESEAALEVGREIGRAVHRTHLYLRERELVEELQELDRHKGEMIATLTHELKNPLTAILGYTELLAEDGGDGRIVEAIDRNVMRLVTLTDDLLLLAKVSDPRRTLTPAPVPVGPLLDEVCDAVAVQADRKEVHLVRHRGAAGAVVLGERDELVRMLVNIVGNAVKYTPSAGQVTLAARRTGDRVELRCTDTGLGIRPDDVGRVFDEFDRCSNPAALAEPGSGLGLAIVKRIADRHGAELSVESELGCGSTFSVRLPVAG